MIELNLLPDVKQEFVRAQRLKRLIISLMILISIVAVGVVAVLAFYVYAAQPIRQALVDNDIKSYSNKLKDNKNLTRDLTIQSQLASLSDLHSQKNDFSRLIDFLMIINPAEPNNAIMSSITIDANSNTISLDAQVLDYNAIATLEDTFRNTTMSYKDSDGKTQKTKLFTSVERSQAGSGKDQSGNQTASAKFLLTYQPDAFAWNIKNVKVAVPIENTTPSAKRVSIFSDQAVTKDVQGGL